MTKAKLIREEKMRVKVCNIGLYYIEHLNFAIILLFQQVSLKIAIHTHKIIWFVFLRL